MWISSWKYNRLQHKVYDLERRVALIENVRVPIVTEEGAHIDGAWVNIAEVVQKLIDIAKLRKIYRQDDYKSGPLP